MKLAIVTVAMLASSAAGAGTRAAVINLQGCASVGPSPMLNWSLIADGYLNASMMALGFHAGMPLCDAELPPEATRFDFAELEYDPGTMVGPPWMIAYAARRVSTPTGDYLSLEELGSCGGLDPRSYPPWNDYSFDVPLSLCQTTGGIDLPGAPSEALSVLFLVVVPVDHFASSDSQPEFLTDHEYFSRVYRIVEYYEQ
jgi:hypothetical protein